MLAADLVLVEATAAGVHRTAGLARARVPRRRWPTAARCPCGPWWAAAGACPTQASPRWSSGCGDVRVPWDAEADVVPLALAAYLANEHGVSEAADVRLAAECPLAHELLR